MDVQYYDLSPDEAWSEDNHGVHDVSVPFIESNSPELERERERDCPPNLDYPPFRL